MPHPDLPDQFLYARKGPWPQPSPSYPLDCAEEVLNIPPVETLLYNATIGQRYLVTQFAYPPYAAMIAVSVAGWTGPTDARFAQIMFDTVYLRFMKPLDDQDKQDFATMPFAVTATTRKYDFSAMPLIDPLPGTFVAATTLVFDADPVSGACTPRAIIVNKVCVLPADSAWGLAKLYALQGAAYHALFVVHPALHFPMDSVNAITKTAVPIAHPLFQMLYPHTNYTLALDNSVLESSETVVNDNAQGTRFDPLTANARTIKKLFGAGYAGLPEADYGNAYPAYDYMNPPILAPEMAAYPFGKWLQAYFAPFLGFASAVADHILANPHLHEYTRRWAHYNHAHVRGFPDDDAIFQPGVLARVLAIYTWDTTVAHGVDHASFSLQLQTVEKCLRIRRAPPASKDDAPVAPGEIFSSDDMARAALCERMFFRPWAIFPNLNDTQYAFTDAGLQGAVAVFHAALVAVSQRTDLQQFMALTPDAVPPALLTDPTITPYMLTIPQSIQY
jgi:hypothetical protein